jgi:glutathione synthase/RimK-type ligase-like ATP-grasp enzyme
VWDDPAVDWSAYRLAVVRSTWDYTPRRDEFVAWAERVGSLTRLENSAATLRWNTDKRYLRTLAEKGIPVVPTHWIEPGDPVRFPFDTAFVVKPAVSAGAKDTSRYSPADERAATDHVRRLQGQGRVVMVQPYLARLDEAGETGMIYLDGAYSHAIRKGAILRPDVTFVNGLYATEDIRRRDPSDAERKLAERVLAAVPGTLYARVDVAPGPGGDPLLLELELTEPSLFFGCSDGAERRLAAAIARRLTSG